MSSLFNDGCCQQKGDTVKTKCKGCACDFFRQLSDQLTGFCNTTGIQTFIIVLKGTNAPLNLGGTTTPTLFRFVTFDPKDCCVVLAYDITVDSTTVTRNYITDCRSIAGVSCVNNGDIGTGVAL